VEIVLRVLVVAASLGGVALGLLLDPAAGGAGRLSLGGFTLPGLCAFYELTGIPCPGCGLTRSWVSALHGDLGASLTHHPLGWLVLLYVLAQGVRHAAWLALPARRVRIDRIARRLDRGIALLGILLLVAWVPRVVALLLAG
jgi:hypothetical protein